MIPTTGKTRMVDILGRKTQREWAEKHRSFAAHHCNVAKANVAEPADVTLDRQCLAPFSIQGAMGDVGFDLAQSARSNRVDARQGCNCSDQGILSITASW